MRKFSYIVFIEKGGLDVHINSDKVIEKMPIGLMVTDLNHTILFLNKAAGEILKILPKDVIGKKLDDCPGNLPNFLNYLKNENNMENYALNKDKLDGILILF